MTNPLSTDIFACPACGADWTHGWPCIRELIEYLRDGLYRGGCDLIHSSGTVHSIKRDKPFDKIKCIKCKRVFNKRELVGK